MALSLTEPSVNKLALIFVVIMLSSTTAAIVLLGATLFPVPVSEPVSTEVPVTLLVDELTGSAASTRPESEVTASAKNNEKTDPKPDKRNTGPAEQRQSTQSHGTVGHIYVVDPYQEANHRETNY